MAIEMICECAAPNTSNVSIDISYRGNQLMRGKSMQLLLAMVVASGFSAGIQCTD